MLVSGGAPRANVSSQALGCTFASSSYPINLGEREYRIWDTAGLNEGQHGTMPAEDALNNLRTLVQNLGDGVNLLVYCIRGSRFRDILRVNYDLFAGIICQGKVPVVAVISGLENEESMDDWWEENKEEFEARGLSFQGQACVTTSKGKMKNGSFMFEEEYRESERKIKELLKEHCKLTWKNDNESWVLDIGVRMAAYMERYNNRMDNEREVLNPPTLEVQVVESSIQWDGVAPHSRGSNVWSRLLRELRELTSMVFGGLSEIQNLITAIGSSSPGTHVIEPAARVPASAGPQLMAANT